MRSRVNQMCRGNRKTDLEIQAMRLVGRIAAKIMRISASVIIPGITTIEIDDYVGELIKREGAKSAFLGYQNFPRNCCVSVNEEVVHGIGSKRRLQFGDLVKLDVGVSYHGFIGDMAMSIPCGGCSPDIQKLVDVTLQALRDGIVAVRCGNKVSDISRAIQSRVENNDFSIVREFVGHGVGQSVHEYPQIPNFVDSKSNTRLLSGMTIAIEPMVNAGKPDIEILSDGWTVVTRDRTMSAHFEHTVLVTDTTAEILTIDGEMPLF